MGGLSPFILLAGATGYLCPQNPCSCTSTTAGISMDCAGLSLTSVPSGIDNTTVHLRLGNNLIGSYLNQPFSAGENVNLLDISSNPVRNIEDGMFGGFTQLTTFLADSALLTTVARFAFSPISSSIQVLVLANNELHSLHEDTLASMSRLTTLDLSGNRLTGFVPGFFDDLTRLITLDLGGNLLSYTSLLDNTFQGLAQLNALILASNNLARLHAQLFRGLDTLSELDLSGNALGATLQETRPFNGANLTSLSSLYLNTNTRGYLTKLPSDAFDDLPALSRVKLAGSTWDCCNIQWLANNQPTMNKVEDYFAIDCLKPERAVVPITLSLSNAEASTDPYALGRCNTHDAPDTPNRPLLESTSSNSITVSWDHVEGNAAVVQYYILQYASGDCNFSHVEACWSTVLCPTGQFPARTTNVDQASVDCEILPRDPSGNPSLEPWTTPTPRIQYELSSLPSYRFYAFRVRAHQVSGQSDFSLASDLFRTNSSTPSEPVDISSISESFAIEIRYAEPRQPGGVILGYNMSVFTTGGILIGEGTAVGTARRIACNLCAGVDAATGYRAEIQARTKAGHGPRGVVTFTTPEAAPERPVLPPYLNSTGDTFIDISWSDPSEDASNGVWTEQILYRCLDATDTICNETQICIVRRVGSSDSRPCRDSELEPDTTYYYRTRFSTAAGTSDASSAAELETLDGISSPPQHLRVAPGSGITTTSIVMQWSPPLSPNGDITAYDLERQSEGTTVMTRVNCSGDGNVGCSVSDQTGLEAFQSYSFRVRAITGGTSQIVGNYSIGVDVRTAPSTPSDVGRPTVVAVSATALRVTWIPPAQSRGLLQYYFVQRTQKSRLIQYYPHVQDYTAHNFTVNASLTSYLDSGLDPYTNYTYAIQASNAHDKQSLPVNQQTGQTLGKIPELQPAPLAIALGHSSIMLKWNPPQRSHGRITSFNLTVFRGGAVHERITLRSDSNTDAPVEYYLNMNNQTTFSYNFSNLEEDTTYRFQMVTCNDVPLCSAPSPLVSEITASTEPSTAVAIVIAVICVAISLTAVGFVWEHERDRVAVVQWSTTSQRLNHFDRTFDDPDPFVLSSGSKIPAHNQEVLDESDSGSSYDEELTQRPSLASLVSLSKVARKFSLGGDGGGLPAINSSAVPADAQAAANV